MRKLLVIIVVLGVAISGCARQLVVEYPTEQSKRCYHLCKIKAYDVAQTAKYSCTSSYKGEPKYAGWHDLGCAIGHRNTETDMFYNCALGCGCQAYYKK